MIALDDLLHDAANRLDHATATVIAPDLPDPSRTGARVAVGLVCLAAVGAAGYAVSIRRDGATPAAALPPGLREGRYGTEIVMSEIPDGDNDPETFSLEANPGGGYVKVTKPTGGTTKVTVSDGSEDTTAADVCLDAPSGGFCGSVTDLETTTLIAGPRTAAGDGVAGQVVVYGLPESAVAVTFAAGDERHWSEPMHGIAAFPFPDSAAAEVTVDALDSEGAVVWEQSTTDSSLTPAEIEAITVTHETAAYMAEGYFGEVPEGNAWGPEVIRRHGRTALTGFTGPFSSQSYVLGPTPARQGPEAGGNSHWVYAITVPTDQLPAMLDRLGTLRRGRVRKTVEPTEGVRVVIWGGDEVADDEIDRFAGTLVQRPPQRPFATDLDRPTAWAGGTSSPLSGEDGSPLAAILTDVVSTVDGHELIAQGDDTGVVQFHVALTDGSYASLGGPRDPNEWKLTVGGSTVVGLMPLASDVTGYTITLDDGTVVEPEIIDVRSLVDGKLMYFADAHEGRTIADIDITTE